MFQGLTSFGFQRHAVQAIGFYLVYTIIGLVALGALGGIAALVTGAQSLEEGMALGLWLGPIFAVVFVAALSFMVLRAKGLLQDVGISVIAVAGVIATGLVGILVGMIVVAFLTTRPANPFIDAEAHPTGQTAAF